MDNIRSIFCDLPLSIKGYTIATADGYFTIVLNQNLSREQNLESYAHEVDHILNGDFDKKCSADLIEFNAH